MTKCAANSEAFDPSFAGHLDVLGSVSEQCRREIFARGQLRRIKKGTVIWNQGDETGYVGFLLHGSAISSYCSPTGKSGVTGIWFPGDLLGAADIGGYPERQLTLRALTNIQLRTIDTRILFEIAGKFPELNETLIRALSTRLRWVAQLALTLETMTALERLCVILVSISEKFFKNGSPHVIIDFRVTHEELSGMVGVSRQFLNQLLGDLQNRKLIRIRYRKIEILDIEKLMAYAKFLDGLSANSVSAD